MSVPHDSQTRPGETCEDPCEPGTARWRALGSWVQLAVDPPTALGPARAAAAALLEKIDRACSRFRPDSDLSRANLQAGRWVKVSPLLAQALVCALAAARDTDGLVDPTLALSQDSPGRGLVAAAGRNRSRETSMAPRPAVPGAWRSLGVDPEGAVRVPVGTGLDLGAIGKAFAVDLVAARVSSQLDVDLVISIGGDVAIGSRPRLPSPVPWLLPIEDHTGELVDGADGPADGADLRTDGTNPVPTTQTGREELVRLARGGMATSCAACGPWHNDSRRPGQLIDPRTGERTRGIWRAATVVGRSCVEANTASTAALLLGDRAHAWLAARGLPARLVDRDGRVRYLGDWPD